MSFGQYLQDTRAELRHVAWPTQMQTIVYTVLVIAISIFIALYLGLFDYIFTGTLARAVGAGGQPTTVTQQPIATSSNQTPAIDINNLLPSSGTNTKK